MRGQDPTATHALSGSMHTGLLSLTQLVSHGIAEHDNRTRRIFFPPQLFATADTNRATSGGTPNIAHHIGLPNMAQAAISAILQMPSDAVSGVPICRFLWATDGSAQNDVVFRITALVLADGTDAVGAGTSTIATFTTPVGADIVRISTITFPISLAANDFFRLTFDRRDADAADTFLGWARFMGIELQYTSDE